MVRMLLCLSLSVGAAVPAAALSVAEARAGVQARSLDYLNVPYLWGGEDPDSGLDCSGFTQLVFERAGLDLPRNSRAQYAAVLPVRPEAVRPGDLAFFDMKGRGRVDHVGIYLGKGYFIHASYSQGVVVERLDKDYWMGRLAAMGRYAGFGR